MSAFETEAYTDEEILYLVLEVKLAKHKKKKAAKQKIKKDAPLSGGKEHERLFPACQASLGAYVLI